MTNLETILKVYVNTEVLPEVATKVKTELVKGMQDTFHKNNPVRSGYGYDTGQLYRDIGGSGRSYKSGNDWYVEAGFTVNHGEYIQYGTSKGIKGIDFMGHGLKHIKKLYGG